MTALKRGTLLLIGLCGFGVSMGMMVRAGTFRACRIDPHECRRS